MVVATLPSSARIAPPEPLLLDLRGGRASVFPRSTDVDPELWRATFSGTPKDFEYYRLIEETLQSHFDYRYLVLLDCDDEPLALQPLIIVDQDLAASAGPKIARAVSAFRGLVPGFLKTRMLLAGCVVGDGKLGLCPGTNPRRAATLLSQALLLYAERERISLVGIKDFPATAREDLAPLRHAGFTRLEGFPSLELHLDFADFDQYMAQRLSKVTRKGLRRKLRMSDRVTPPITLEVLDGCRDVLDEIYPLYLAVAERSAVSFEVFTPEYFLEAGRRMPGRYRYFVWRQGDKVVAFSFCTVWEDTIWDNDIGLDYSVAHDLNLYHVTFRDLIDWALRHGLRRYCSAPFNYEPKLNLRMELLSVDLYVRHTSSLANALVSLVAPFFAPAKSDPVLRRHFKKANA